MKMKILGFAILLMVSGCSKESIKLSNGEGNTPSKLASSSTKIDVPYNPKNPADSIGIIHNAVLQFVYRKLAAGKDFSNDQKKKFVAEFFKNRYGGEILIAMEQRQQFYKQYKNIPIAELTKKFGCSQTLSKTVNDIFSATREMKSPADYNSFRQKIMVIEGKVLTGELKLSRTEADQLLHFTSIYRHSMYFWMDEVIKNPGKSNAEFLRKFIRALLGASADAYGAVYSLFSYMSFRYVLEDASLDSAMMLWAFG